VSLLAENKIRIPLGISKIYSDRTGINQILDFYFKCQDHNDCTIEICLTDLEWFDGNLCSLLGATYNKKLFRSHTDKIKPKT